MEAVTTAPLTAADPHSATRTHIRGSSLMLVGRVLSLAMNFLIQILTVRYLAKSDYGAYAYALSVVNLGSMLALLCLDKAMARFLPVYHERQDYPRLFGAVVLAAGTTLALGGGLVVAFYALQGWIGHSCIRDRQAFTLVLILIVLSPLDALDSLIGNLFAVFAKPREIFFPRHLLGPALHLAVVLWFIAARGDVFSLAVGGLAASVLGTAVHAGLLSGVLREQGLLNHFDARTLRLPGREIFGFTLPLLVSDLVYVLRSSLVVVLLERFHNTTDVAAFQAVFPVARLNLVVFQSFMVLFMPVAGRLFARGDYEAINRLYWQSAVWIALFTFPLLAVSFSLAQPVTVLLFGARYAQSAGILALLAFGHYFNAALGFNGLTLQVFGKVRYIVLVDLVGALLGLGVNVLLIWRYGATGAAVGTCGTLVLQNLLYQAGLRLGGVRVFDWRYARVYGAVLLGAAGLLLFQSVTSAPLLISLPAATVVSLLLIHVNRGALDLESTFPELMRIPIARRLLVSGGGA